MKFKSTLAMLLALCAIGSYYFFVDIPQEKKQKKEKERSEKIILFDKDQVESITIVRSAETIQVKKEEDQWERVWVVATRDGSERSKEVYKQGESGWRVIMYGNTGEVFFEHPVGDFELTWSPKDE